MRFLYHECYEIPTKDLVGFYYPGRNTPIDEICNAGFLSNFWLDNLVADRIVFKCAEAAYQGTKFTPEECLRFSNCDGREAFQLSRELKCRIYTPPEAWANMMYILEQKFLNPKLADLLLDTKDAFLLEHNNVIGRDSRWSNNGDGTGSNWLGLQLMILRDSIRESRLYKFHISHDPFPWSEWISKHLDPNTGIFFYGMEIVWQQMVAEASDTIISEIASAQHYGSLRINTTCIFSGCNNPQKAPYQFCCRRCANAHYALCSYA